MKKILFFLMMTFALCAANDVEAKTKKFKNGDLYDGEIVKGIITGVGVMKYANGDVYNGSWSAGIQDGKGVMTYTNGDKYDGNWKGGKRWGQGKMTYANGDVYIGNWEDVRAAKGVIKFKNGESYSGNWFNDSINGEGTYTYLNKNKLNCMWRDGKPFTKGTINYANGDNYVGGIKDVKRSGTGTLTSKQGYVCKGEWVENELIDGTKSITKSDGYVIPQGFISLTQTVNNKEVTTNEIKYSGDFSYKGAVDKFNREGNGTYYYNQATGCSVELSGVWQGDNLVKGSGIIKSSEIGDKFDIQSVGESKYKVTVYKGGRSIYSEVVDTPLDNVILNKLCNLKAAIEKSKSKAYHDKYLKEKIFVYQTPVNSHPSLKTIGTYFDVSSLSIFEFILFDDSDAVACKAIYVDKRRLKREDRSYLAQQNSQASSIADHYNKEPRKEFKLDEGYIVIGSNKYRYIASENVLYDEKNKLKMKAVTSSEFEKMLKEVVNNALIGAVYGAEGLSK